MADRPPQKKAFSFYRSYHDILKHLNDKQYVQLSRAINNVMFFECHIDSISFKDKMVSALWSSIKHTIQASIDGFIHKNKTDYDSLLTTPYKGACQGATKGACQQEEGEGEEKEEVKEKERKRARPRDAFEVINYAKTISFVIDGQAFIDHYDTNGWMRGNSKIKCWKACVRTWKARQKVEDAPAAVETFDPFKDDLKDLREMQEEGTALFANGKPIVLDGNQFHRTDLDNAPSLNAYAFLKSGNKINSGVTI